MLEAVPQVEGEAGNLERGERNTDKSSYVLRYESVEYWGRNKRKS